MVHVVKDRWTQCILDLDILHTPVRRRRPKYDDASDVDMHESNYSAKAR